MIRFSLLSASLLLAGAAQAGSGDSQMTVGHEPQPKPSAHGPHYPHRPYWPRLGRDKARCELDRPISRDDPCSDNRLIRRDKEKSE